MGATTIIINVKDTKQLKALKTALKTAGIGEDQIMETGKQSAGKTAVKEDLAWAKLAEKALAEDWKDDVAWEKVL